MTQQDIQNLLANGERVMLECKRAKSSVPNSVWETYSAFANTYGGTILLGVEEDMTEKDTAKRFSIIGVEDAHKVQADFWNMLNNTEKVSTNLLKDEDVQIVEVGGKDVLAITVPRAEVGVRPVYIKGNPLQGTFKRNHEGDYHTTSEEIRMMLRDANDDGNDRLFLEHYTMDDIDTPTLVSYRNRFSSAHPDHVWNDLSHKDFLKQFGCYVVDRNTGEEGLTMAGLMMFGKGLPIRERFGNLRMDYIDKSDLTGEQRYSDRITYDGTWENNLYNFVEMVLPKLLRELPRPFQMEGVIRVDDTLQHKAVREAFTNMIIHADLMLNGLLRVVKYDNRFEFTNPGLLKLPIERIYAGDESKARNQNIQALFRMIGFGEGIGSGFPLILKAWEEKNWLRPELIEEQDLMQVKLVLYIEHDKQNVTNNVTDNVTNDTISKLTDRQRKIIDMMHKNAYITVDELSQNLSVTRRTILRDLKALQEMSVIIREGSNKSGRWIIKDKGGK